ncbi:MAG TPA: type IV secretion system protein [Streptosporangiaceae bacterium]
MLRFRLPRKTALALVLLAVLFAMPRVVAHPGQHAAAWRHGQPVAATTLAATTSTISTTSAGGGPCSVPGIGDIGGLLGFCSLGSSGTLLGSLNGLCSPGVPEPESATAGVNALISPPAPAGKPVATPYNQYGMSGQYWAATDLGCSDMTSLIGNDVAGMLFDFAKAMDRVTITIYQSAAGEGILSWLQGVTDRLITGLGNAIYFPYVAVVVIIAAIWLAWQGLIRKRGTRTIEGTIWMVVACAAAIWLIGRPADFTGLGKGVSDGISTTLNTAFAHLPSPGEASCLPVKGHDPQISQASFSYTSGRTVVDQNANELWTVLVCKPWVDGEFGTTAFSGPGGKATPVAGYARSLLWAQAIAANERATPTLITAKQDAYAGIAQSIKTQDASVYPLFQGKEWTTRLEIAFAALLAALVAGVLVLLISVTLILLKLGFLLLLIVGPFFLLVGTHPGFGRVVAVRWFEMLVGVLLKQAAVAIALSVLLYCYALIMGTADSVLPWALKILMITLVTVAVFIYRKPFQHLFAAVGYGAIGSTDRAEADLAKAAATARTNTRTAATIAVPGFAAYRAARWARQNPGQAAGLAVGAVSGGTSALAASAAAGMDGSGTGPAGGDYHGGSLSGGGGSGSLDPAGPGVQSGAAARARAWGASSGAAPASQAPPLRLPPRRGGQSNWPPGGSAASAGPAAGSGSSASPPAPPPLVRSSGPATSPGGAGRGSSGQAASAGRPGPGAGGSPRPPRPVRPRPGGSAPPAGAGQSGSGRSARNGSAGRPSADSGTDRAPGAGRVPRSSRSSRLSGQRRPGGNEGSNGSNGDVSMTPFGLQSGGAQDNPSAGPFWSRPVWRRK